MSFFFSKQIGKKINNEIQHYGSIWYMCLKIENCYLKIFVEIRVGEKVYRNT